MKKRILWATFTFFCLSFAFSQTFEKGYYVDNNNNKVDCLIKDMEWEYNPVDFEYKKDEHSAIAIMSFKNIQEFGIEGEFKYIKAAVKIDKSDDRLSNVTPKKALELVDEVLLLKVLTEGKATLFGYKTQKFTRFFYSLNQGSITQLSYKVYFDEDLQSYRKNEAYKQEILNNLKCDKITENYVENLDYSATRLTNIFKEFNRCIGSEVKELKVKKNYNTLEFYVKGGVGFSSLKYDSGSNEADFGNKVKFRPAVEMEVNFSNKKKDFSLLLELSYQYYKATANLGNGTADIDANYNSLDISFGGRKYFYLNANSMLFLNAYLTYASAINSDFGVLRFKVDNTFSPAIGIGYLFNQKYTLEARYELNRDILGDYSGLSAKYNSIGLNFGYKLL